MFIVDEKRIENLIAEQVSPSEAEVLRVIEKGLAKRGLSIEEAAVLLCARDPVLVEKIFAAAAKIKDDIYGERLVLFAPLYLSDHCVNDCAYCNFHGANRAIARRRLTMEEIAAETACLVGMGHKRLLVECGEDPERNSIDYVCEAIRTIYSVKGAGGAIRRVNVNVAATSVADYRKLKAERIGTYQLFAETYHRATYEALHRGPKADYERQVSAHARAFEAGIDDLGIGVLFGLYDWRFEVLSLISHAQWMEKNLGVGPHTISVPRFRPAPSVAYRPSHAVSDDDFLRLVAILRIAVPYTGMILSTREPPAIRARAFKLGISQASAASVTTPGGYFGQQSQQSQQGNVQFETRDRRPLSEIVESVVDIGLVPSFCTACYRKGRTGEAFMDLAKPGEIHELCRPNALITFAEYLEDFGSAKAKEVGGALIERVLGEIADESLHDETRRRIADIRSGRRDVFF